MTDFGSGPFLSRNLDFEVTSTGDIRTVNGTEELEKDIALQSLIRLQDIIGSRQTPRTRAVIRSRVNEILVVDPRIEEVLNTTVRFVQGKDSAEVVTTVVSDNSEQELVFNV